MSDAELTPLLAQFQHEGRHLTALEIDVLCAMPSVRGGPFFAGLRARRAEIAKEPALDVPEVKALVELQTMYKEAGWRMVFQREGDEEVPVYIEPSSLANIPSDHSMPVGQASA